MLAAFQTSPLSLISETDPRARRIEEEKGKFRGKDDIFPVSSKASRPSLSLGPSKDNPELKRTRTAERSYLNSLSLARSNACEIFLADFVSRLDLRGIRQVSLRL